MATITTAGNGNWSSTTPNAPWPSGTLPGISDTAVINHIVTLDLNTNVGGIDAASTGCIIGSSTQYRVLVGIAGRPCYVLRAVVL